MNGTILYPGTFDPPTSGHLDLVQRAARIFDEVVVAVAENPSKQEFFSMAERIALLEQIAVEIKGARVIGFDDLLIDCMRRERASVILRGLRAVSDFEYEFQLASMNRRLDPGIETIFLTPAENYTFISASLVREVARLGGDITDFVHPVVGEAVKQKLGRRKR